MTDSTTSNIDKIVTEAPTLADRAMLSVLRRAPLKTIRAYDEATQREIREQLGDESAQVKTHLFRDKTNPVRKLIVLDGQLYAAHREITLPWVDAGPRLLVGEMWERARDLITKFDREMTDLRDNQILPNWDALVQQDINYRQQAAMADPDPVKRQEKLNRISAAEYPSQDDIASRFSVKWRTRPIGSDARCDLPDHAKEQMKHDLQAELDDAVTRVKKDLSSRMMLRIDTAIKSLARQLPDGSYAKFNDNTIDSIKETLDIIGELNVTNDPDVDAAIEQAIIIVHGDMPTAAAIRSTDNAREKTMQQLNELKDMFGGMA